MQVTKASIRRGLLFSASILALSGLGTAAHAQSAEGVGNDALREIIVTAQKRS